MKKKLIQFAKTINITGTNGKTTTSKIIELVLIKLGYKVGLTGSAGIYINGVRVKRKDRSGPKSYQYLHEYREKLDIIIVENVLRHIKNNTFYPDQADICLITNIADDHIHQTPNNSIEEIALIKSKLTKRNRSTGLTILNADNQYTKIISKKTNGEIVYFGINTKPNCIASKALYYHFKDNKIFRLHKGNKIKLLDNINKYPLTYNLNLNFNIYNILSAIAVLDNLPDLELQFSKTHNILKTIDLTYKFIPGRFNIFNFNDFTVILDKAHNPKSYMHVFKSLVSGFEYKRLVSIIKSSRTRNDNFIKKLGSIAAQYSNFIYIKENIIDNPKKRGRYQGKVANLLRSGIRDQNFDMQKTKTIIGERKAVKEAIDNSRPGDLLIIFGYKIDDLNTYIKQLQSKYLSSLQTSS